MTLPLQGKYLLVGIGLCIKIYLPSPPRMTCIFYYQDQNNHPPHNSQFSTLHVLLDLYWDAETCRAISGAPRKRPSVHKYWIMNWECVMTTAKEEVSTFNLHLQPKRALPVNHPQLNKGCVSPIHNTITKRAVIFFPISFHYYLLVTFTSGINNTMTIQTKRKSSNVNKFFMISYMLG